MQYYALDPPQPEPARICHERGSTKDSQNEINYSQYERGLIKDSEHKGGLGKQERDP